MVWIALLILTAVTITVAKMNLGNLSVAAALFIASLKSALVVYFFMHLKYEEKLFKIMFLVAVATLALIIGFTFFDTSFR